MPEIPGGDEATGTERAVLDLETTGEVADLIARYAQTVLGSTVERVVLRSGRIDVVWGVELADGRSVAIKLHRQPVDLDVLRAIRSAKETLAASDFPLPHPIAGPDGFEGHIVSAETLLSDGAMPDGTDSAERRLIVAGLADHIALLRSRSDLQGRVGVGPSWCRYHDGPWPVPHDTLVDFTVTEPEWQWLDDYGRRVADQILAHRGDERLLGHADWYAGNLVTDGERLTGSFDWEFVVEPESVIAGLAAAAFGAGPDSENGISTPDMAREFLEEYAAYRGRPFSADEWAAASGAVAWILVFNARWQVGLFPHGMGDRGLIELVRTEGERYLDLAPAGS